MKEEITNAQLFRFCAGETTVKENDRIAAWLDENPEEHQQRLNDVHSMYLVSILCDESEAKRLGPTADRHRGSGGPACPDFTQRRFGGRSEFRKPAHLPFDFQWQGTPGQTRR